MPWGAVKIRGQIQQGSRQARQGAKQGEIGGLLTLQERRGAAAGVSDTQGARGRQPGRPHHLQGVANNTRQKLNVCINGDENTMAALFLDFCCGLAGVWLSAWPDLNNANGLMKHNKRKRLRSDKQQPWWARTPCVTQAPPPDWPGRPAPLLRPLEIRLPQAENAMKTQKNVTFHSKEEPCSISEVVLLFRTNERFGENVTV